MASRRTPLHDQHVALGARMVEFAGWSMPLQYQGIVAEHRATRSAAGLFDVSHMGEIDVRGPGAAEFLERSLTNRVGDLEPGRCRYSLMCNPAGGILDDLVLCREAADAFLLVVNAANTEADFQWLAGMDRRGCDVTDVSAETALLAVQGPRSREAIALLLGPEEAARLAALRFFRLDRFRIGEVETVISRTGYTGDLGYEVRVPAASAVHLWGALLDEGRAVGLVPVGLGARDTLRLEAGLCLHGHDIGPDRNPIEASLERFVDLEKGEFVGSAALRAVRDDGPAERLVGLEVIDRGIIREGCEVRVGGDRVGVVTSGTFGPWVERAIGLAYLRRDLAGPGMEVAVMVRGRPLRSRVVERPFHRPS